MKKLFFLIFIFYIGLLSGCSSSPSDGDVLQYIKQKYSRLGKIENYKRLNDYETKDGYHVVEYQFDILLDIDKLRNIEKSKNPLETLPYTTLLLLVSIQCPDILEGEDRCTIQDKTTFVKGENGWVPVK